MYWRYLTRFAQGLTFCDTVTYNIAKSIVDFKQDFKMCWSIFLTLFSFFQETTVSSKFILYLGNQ